MFTGPNRHTAIDRWFATVKTAIQQQTDGSLHFAEEQLSSANNLLSHAPGRTRCKSFQCALRLLQQWRRGEKVGESRYSTEHDVASALADGTFRAVALPDLLSGLGAWVLVMCIGVVSRER